MTLSIPTVLLRSLLLVLALFLAPAVNAGAAEPDLLEPEKAFVFSARVVAPDAIEVRYLIAKGYYMYRDKFRFSAEPAAVQLGEPRLPPGERKKDEFFGETEVYRGDLRIVIPVSSAGDGRFTLKAVSQGCADIGVCYVPVEQRAELRLAAVSGPAAGSAVRGEDTLIADLFRGSTLWLMISFFGFGLLLSFTPCVLPMVPILSGIIVGQGAKVTRMHGFMLSVAYVLGMAITYALAGVAAGLSGAMLAATLQNPWVLGAFALVFVALALSMFGLYELQLPTALQSRLAEASGRLPGGRFAGVFVMGALSALIVGPCVAAPLAGALLYISQSGDALLGAAALFAMALGMGVPLLAVGASAGTLLPKAGPWMEGVKRCFGMLLLAVAVYLVSPVIPVAVQMLAWSALLIFSGVYLHALDPLPPHAGGAARAGKGLGILLLVAGIAYLVGGLSGGRDVLQPLSDLRAGNAVAAGGPVAFQKVANERELDAAIAAAAGKVVMLDFYADWCVSCKEMERYTFTDPAVRERLAKMVKIQADITTGSADHQALLRRFRLFGPPGIVFFDASGREIQGLRVIGFQPAGKFAGVLDLALGAR
ncbi:MAG: protein-disulfide reductase DsbD [Betaproteobacteria bacterium]|jgi:thiol:disulfide interchange protein DsbD